MVVFVWLESDALFFERINTGIDHDTLYPGTNRAVETESMQMPEYLDKGILKGIFSIQWVAEHAQADIVHRFRIALVQLRLCLWLLALAGGDEIAVNRCFVQRV